MSSGEVWKAIPGHRGAYQASTLGRVRNARTGKLIAGSRHSAGYLETTLQGRRYTLHRLIMLTFVGPRPRGLEICHRNNNKQDNRLSNLRYDTRQGNADDTQFPRGEDHHAAHLTEAQVLEIVRLRMTLSAREISRKLGLKFGLINSILCGVTWGWLTSKLIADTKPNWYTGVSASRSLNRDTVRTIAARLKRGDRYSDIAKDAGVHEATIGNIRLGKAWGHITGFKRPERLRKLTAKEALEIFKSTEPIKEVAAKYGVADATVSFIRNGKLWATVTGKQYSPRQRFGVRNTQKPPKTR